MFKLFKKKEFSGMDLPPPPPPAEGMPQPAETELKFPDMPPLPEIDESLLSLVQKKEEIEKEMPEFPELKGEDIQPIFTPIQPDAQVENPFGIEIKKPFMPPKSMPSAKPIEEPKPQKAYFDIPEKEEIEIREEGKEILKRPLFVKSDNFRDVIDDINTIKSRIKESEYIVQSLNDIKNTRDKEFEKWRNNVEDIQRKLMGVDRMLFEKRG